MVLRGSIRVLCPGLETRDLRGKINSRGEIWGLECSISWRHGYLVVDGISSRRCRRIAFLQNKYYRQLWKWVCSFVWLLCFHALTSQSIIMKLGAHIIKGKECVDRQTRTSYFICWKDVIFQWHMVLLHWRICSMMQVLQLG